MNNIFFSVCLYCSLVFLASCLVSNNLYVNDPAPVGKDEYSQYGGVGTGLAPLNDPVKNVKGGPKGMGIEPILSAAIQAGIGEKTDFRFAFHVPVSFNGAGIRLGIQQSFFNTDSKFNLAFGTDIGGAVSTESITLGPVTIGNENATNGAINADLFVPVSYRFNNDYKIVLTPRYSNNVFFRGNKSQFDLRILTLGFFTENFYFEHSASFLYNHYHPQFGVAWNFDDY